MGHTLELALGVVDGRSNASGELLEQLGEMSFLGSGFTTSNLLLRVLLDTAIRIKTSNGTVGLGQDLATLLNQRSDLSNKLLLLNLGLGRNILEQGDVPDSLSLVVDDITVL